MFVGILNSLVPLGTMEGQETVAQNLAELVECEQDLKQITLLLFALLQGVKKQMLTCDKKNWN